MALVPVMNRHLNSTVSLFGLPICVNRCRQLRHANLKWNRWHSRVFKIDLKPSLCLYKIVYNEYNRPTIGLQFNEFQKSVSHFSTSPRPRLRTCRFVKTNPPCCCSEGVEGGRPGARCSTWVCTGASFWLMADDSQSSSQTMNK